MVFQILIHGGFQSVQRIHKGGNFLLNPIVLTVLFLLQQQLVALFQFPLHVRGKFLHHLFHGKEIFLPQGGTVHLPAPVHQIMCLINEKKVILP